MTPGNRHPNPARGAPRTPSARLLPSSVQMSRSLPAAVLVAAALTLAIATAPAAALERTPTHVALSWQGDPRTTQSFCWRTLPDVEGTVVELTLALGFDGFDHGARIQVEGESRAWEPIAGDGGDPARIHEVEVSGLLADTAYTYRIGSGAPDEWSETATFVTAPDPDVPVTFLHLTDPQSRARKHFELWGRLLTRARTDHPQARFLLVTGDLVDQGYVQRQWDLFFDTAQPDLASLPIAPAIGNHDVLKDETAAHYRSHFHLPRNGPEGMEEEAYSFDYGPVHVAVLDTERELAAQAEWLREDMAGVDRPWKVVALHRGPYGSKYDSHHIRSAWCPAFDELGVDLVLAGHDHAYVRSHPMRDEQPVEEGRGAIYVCAGSAGPKFYSRTFRPWQKRVVDQEIQIYVSVAATDERLWLRAFTIDGLLVDSLAMRKAQAPPPEVSGLVAVADDHKVSLHWTSPAGRWVEKIQVFVAERDGELPAEPVQELDPRVDHVGIRSLNNGVDYDFVVRAVSAEGVASAGVGVTATPLRRDPHCADVTLAAVIVDRNRDQRHDHRVEVEIGEDEIRLTAPFRLDLDRRDLNVIAADPRARVRVLAGGDGLAVVVRARDGTRRMYPVVVDGS